MRWTLIDRHGWLRIDDAESVTVVEADRVVAWGTTMCGFVILTSTEELYFECPAVEARAHVDALWDRLAVA